MSRCMISGCGSKIIETLKVPQFDSKLVGTKQRVGMCGHHINEYGTYIQGGSHVFYSTETGQMVDESGDDIPSLNKGEHIPF